METQERGRKVRIRSCVGCRKASRKEALIRIVRTPSDEVRLDPTGGMPGRGAYVCRTKECLALALKQNRLGKALRRQTPAHIVRELEVELVAEDVGS